MQADGAFFFDLKCGEWPDWEACATDLDCSRTVMQLCLVLEVCGSTPGQGKYFELRFFLARLGAAVTAILSCHWGRFVCTQGAPAENDSKNKRKTEKAENPEKKAGPCASAPVVASPQVGLGSRSALGERPNPPSQIFIRVGGVWVGGLVLGGWVPQNPKTPQPLINEAWLGARERGGAHTSSFRIDVGRVAFGVRHMM